MDHFSTNTTQVTIGLDLGDKFSAYYSLDPQGECLGEGRLRTTPEDLRQHFAGMDRARVALEVGTHSPWVSRLLEACGHEVLVANPRQVRLIYQNKKKCDKFDAEHLARLARIDPKILSPVCHRGEEAQRHLTLIKARDALVRSRTRVVNCVRGVLKSFGLRVPKCSTHNFHSQAWPVIPKSLEPALLPLLEIVKELTARIDRYDQLVEKLAEKKYPDTEHMAGVKGVGALTALAFVLILEDPGRFEKSRNVGSFVGLVPRKDASGEQDPQRRITKAGNSLLRRLLVGSAHYILGPFGPDTDLRRYGMAIAARGGKNAKKRAAVAVARKLAVLLHRLWITGEPYEPLRQANRKAKREGSRSQETAVVAGK